MNTEKVNEDEGKKSKRDKAAWRVKVDWNKVPPVSVPISNEDEAKE